MIISLVTSNIEACLNNKEIVFVIENVLRAYGEAKHYISASKKLLSKISADANKFSEHIRIFANSAISQQIEIDALLENVSYAIEIDLDQKTKFNSTLIDKIRYIQVGYDYFIDSNSTQESFIVGENLTDIQFYEKIAKYYQVKHLLSSTGLKFTPINGGGATTRDVYENIATSNKLCLCIVDNDKKHPNSSIGSTAKRFNNLPVNTTSSVYILEAHEAESLIPTKLIEEIITDNGGENNKIDSIDALSDICEFEPKTKLYFDHKNGITLNKALELDVKYGDFWINAINSKFDLSTYNCCETKKCNTKECPCLKIDGYSDKLLTGSIAKLEKINIRSLQTKLSSPLLEQWNYIGNLFYSWSCAPIHRIRL